MAAADPPSERETKKGRGKKERSPISKYREKGGKKKGGGLFFLLNDRDQTLVS